MSSLLATPTAQCVLEFISRILLHGLLTSKAGSVCQELWCEATGVYQESLPVGILNRVRIRRVDPDRQDSARSGTARQSNMECDHVLFQTNQSDTTRDGRPWFERIDTTECGCKKKHVQGLRLRYAEISADPSIGLSCLVTKT